MTISNRKAFYEYAIEQKYTAGIVLTGTEIKSLRLGKASFNDSYCLFFKKELYIRSLHIAEYGFGGVYNHEPVHDRKLLLQKRELKKIQAGIKEKGLSVIPLKLFIAKNGFAKVEIGMAKGKKLYDKRASIKEKENKREIKRKYGV